MTRADYRSLYRMASIALSVCNSTDIAFRSKETDRKYLKGCVRTLEKASLGDLSAMESIVPELDKIWKTLDRVGKGFKQGIKSADGRKADALNEIYELYVSLRPEGLDDR